MNRFLPLRAGTPYRTRDGRRVVLSQYQSWGLINPATNIVYLPHDGSITNTDRAERDVADRAERDVTDRAERDVTDRAERDVADRLTMRDIA